MLRVDLPSTHSSTQQHTQHPEVSPRTGNRGRTRASRDVARNALIARRAHLRGLPALYICRMQVNTSKHASTAVSSTSISQDVDVSLPAVAESPSPQRIVRGATDRPLSRLIAAYTSVELTPASLAIRQRHRKLPQTGWGSWTAMPSRLSPPPASPWCRSLTLAHER